MHRKLGKRAPANVEKLPRFSAYLDRAALPEAPATENWGTAVSSWPMMLNDTLGDCAIAGPGHMIQAWSANNDAPDVPTDAEILAAYEAVSGYTPSNPSTDAGCVLTDVLAYWLGTGIGGRKIAAYAALDTGDRQHVIDAAYLFGGVLIGLALPLSAEQQVDAGKSWSVVRGRAGKAGSWGGHCVPVVAYDAGGCTVVTWGMLQYMSWPFFGAYADESYAVLSTEWAALAGDAPSGFNFAQLTADLAQIGG